MGDQYYTISGIGLIKSLSDIENALITTRNGKPVLVKDIARIGIGNIPRTGIIAVNDDDDVAAGVVFLRKNAQSIPSIRSIHEKIKELNERILPKGIRVIPFYDKWDLIVAVVKKVVETATFGVGLILIALLIFLGNIRVALITAFIIPISLITTLAIMTVTGESANLLSIGAIDFGIIVDIPLILIENYFRLSRRYGPGSRSLVKASNEVGKPTMFSVTIILLAFMPIFMMRGAEAQIFSPMAKTYLYAIIFTLILTFTYLIASARLFLRKTEDKEYGFLVYLRERCVGVVSRLLLHCRTVLFIMLLMVLAGLATGVHFIGSQFIPKMDEGNIYMRIIFPYSISLEKTYENAKDVRSILLSLPEVKTVEAQVGRPEDGTDPTGPFNSEYYVDLKPYKEWRKGLGKNDLEASIREKMKQRFPNADVSLSQYQEDNFEELMSGVKGENSVKIFGDDLSELDRIAKDVREGLERTPGVEDVGIFRELGQPNLLIKVNRENASALGLTVQDVLDTVAAAIGGKEVTRIIQGEKNFSLMLRFSAEHRKNPESIGAIPIVLPDGGVAALSRVADIAYDTGASFIYRENFRRFIPVKFTVSSKDLGGAVKLAQQEVSKIKLPEGYYMEWSGIFNEMQESFKRFYISIPIAFFLVLSSLFILYRSTRNVLITMIAPLFAVFGGILSLMVTGQSMNVSSIVGFISILGVSILNTSVFVTHYIRLVVGGMENTQAILTTLRDKFRPILMGGVVASLGLLPAALSLGVGSQIQKPLAIVVVGGMLVGTVMILLFAPLLLKFADTGE